MVGDLLEQEHSGATLDATGVEGNARITAATGALLFALLAVEGVTILRIHDLLTAHVFVGMVITAFVVTKLASVGYRFVRYYLGDRAYVRKGAPHVVLRIAGPILVLTTIAVIVTGIAGLAAGRSEHWLIDLHKASFILWFVVTTVHVVGHLLDTPRLAVADYKPRSRTSVVGGLWLRRLITLMTVTTGFILAYAVINSGWMDAWHHLADR